MTRSNNDPNGDTFGVFLSTPMAPKNVRPPVYGTDPQEWTIDAHQQGFYIVDEYGEPVEKVWYSSPEQARARLSEMIAEELEAREQHGPEDGNPHTLPVE